VTGWRVERSTGPAAELHGRPLPVEPVPVVWVHQVSRPAVVLGSTQPAEDVDRRAADSLGVDVVRRRSGGGAVLLEPGASLWVDVVVPASHPAWEDDVSRAARWLGAVWVAALGRVGVDGAAVHPGPMQVGRLGRQVCFAGLGPGEVTVPAGIVGPGEEAGSRTIAGAGTGRAKLVGVSQRRTRAGARFQAIVHHRWDVALQERLLGPGLARTGAAPAGGALAAVAVAVLAVPDDELVEALLAELGGSAS
jgi:lipoate-protein ligase A